MPAGPRWLFLTGGALLVLAGCAADGLDTAPATSGDAATPDVGASSTPASGDSRVAGGTTAVGTVAADVVATGSAPSSGVDAVPTTTVAASTPAGPCAPVVALADAVALAGGIDLTLPWPQLQATIAASSDAAAQSYLAVVPVAPGDIDDDLQVLADYNTTLGEVALASASVTAFQAAVEPPDDALLASTAAVDGYMRDTCSIGLSPD